MDPNHSSVPPPGLTRNNYQQCGIPYSYNLTHTAAMIPPPGMPPLSNTQSLQYPGQPNSGKTATEMKVSLLFG